MFILTVIINGVAFGNKEPGIVCPKGVFGLTGIKGKTCFGSESEDARSVKPVGRFGAEKTIRNTDVSILLFNTLKQT